MSDNFWHNLGIAFRDGAISAIVVQIAQGFDFSTRGIVITLAAAVAGGATSVVRYLQNPPADDKVSVKNLGK